MSRRPGFTLVELLLATTLSTLLLIGVMAVVTGLSSSAGFERSVGATGHATDPAVVDSWLRLLREDFENARRIELLSDTELEVVGYAALDPQSGERTHRPVRVVYAIERVGGRDWVVRRQTALDVLTNKATTGALVCGGLSRFNFIREQQEMSAAQAKALGALIDQRTRGGVSPSGNQTPTGNNGGQSARLRREVDPNTNIFIWDRYYFFKYLPPEVQKRVIADPGQFIPPGQRGEDADEGDPANPEANSTGPIEVVADEDMSAGLWRLHAWVGDEDEPYIDRLVIVK